MRARALACTLDGFGGRCRTAVRCSSGCTCGGWRCCTRSSCSGPQRTTSSFWPQSSERTLLFPAYRIRRALSVPHVPPELPYRPGTVASNSVLQPLFHSTQPALDHPTLAGSPSVSSACASAAAGARPHLRPDSPSATQPRLRRDAPTSAPGLAGTDCGWRSCSPPAACARSCRGALGTRLAAEGARERGSVGQPAFAGAFGFCMLCAPIGAPWVQRPVSREDRERLAVAAAARAARDHRVLGPDAGE
jgi:hypothetical protein